MRALIVYESMFGNTRTIAEHVAAGMGPDFETTTVVVADATPALLAGADLLIVGAPTHAHSLSRASTRKSALGMITPDSGLTLEPHTQGDGIREWLAGIGEAHHAVAAAFDTRIDAPPLLTGRASRLITRRLRRLGFKVIAPPESFLVDKQSHLLHGEGERATAWACGLAATVLASQPPAWKAAPVAPPPVDVPLSLYEPQRASEWRRALQRSQGRPIDSHAASHAIADEDTHRPLHVRFRLPRTIVERLAPEDGDDAVALLVAILGANGRLVERSGRLLRVDDVGLVVLDLPVATPVAPELLDQAYLELQGAGTAQRVVVTTGALDRTDLRRRQRFDSSVHHAGLEDIQHMADAVGLGTDPLFVLLSDRDRSPA